MTLREGLVVGGLERISFANLNRCRYTQIDFWRRCTFPNWNHWNIEYTPKGTAKIRRKRIMRLLSFILAIGGSYRLRQSGLGVKDIKVALRRLVQGSLMNLLQLWVMLRRQLRV